MHLIIVLIGLAQVLAQETSHNETVSKCAAMLCMANTTCVSCVNRCQPTCEEPDRKPCNSGIVCQAGCVCIDGFLLKGNRCVPKSQCSVDTTPKTSFFQRIRNFFKGLVENVRDLTQFDDRVSSNKTNGTVNNTTPECKDDEQFYGCGSCVGTCENPNRFCIQSCRPGNCDCKAGLVRDKKTNKCVDKDEGPCVAQRNKTNSN